MSAPFRERLRRGDRLVGTLLGLPSPDLAEIAADAGFDWLFIDMEHGALEARDVLRMVQAVREPAACLVRVPETSDAGARAPVGIFAGGAAGALRVIEAGYTLVCAGVDSGLYVEAAAALVRALKPRNP